MLVGGGKGNQVESRYIETVVVAGGYAVLRPFLSFLVPLLIEQDRRVAWHTEEFHPSRLNAKVSRYS